MLNCLNHSLQDSFSFTSIHHDSYYPLLYFKKGSAIAGVTPKNYAIRYDGMKIGEIDQVSKGISDLRDLIV
jgi:hypothetical protein